MVPLARPRTPTPWPPPLPLPTTNGHGTRTPHTAHSTWHTAHVARHTAHGDRCELRASHLRSYRLQLAACRVKHWHTDLYDAAAGFEVPGAAAPGTVAGCWSGTRLVHSPLCAHFGLVCHRQPSVRCMLHAARCTPHTAHCTPFAQQDRLPAYTTMTVFRDKSCKSVLNSSVHMYAR